MLITLWHLWTLNKWTLNIVTKLLSHLRESVGGLFFHTITATKPYFECHMWTTESVCKVLNSPKGSLTVICVPTTSCLCCCSCILIWVTQNPEYLPINESTNQELTALKWTTKNFPILNQELLNVVYCLKIFKQYDMISNNI